MSPQGRSQVVWLIALLLLRGSALPAMGRSEVAESPRTGSIRTVVLIHGLADPGLGWGRTAALLKKRGYRVLSYGYKTYTNRLDLPAVAEGLRDRIEGGCPEGEKVALAGHSQGGLVAEWYHYFVGKERVARVVSFGTPFQGNGGALFAGKKLIRLSPLMRKQLEGLIPGSPEIMKLVRARVEGARGDVPYTAAIGRVGGILGTEGDIINAVCEANPNAIYMRKKEIDGKPRAVPHDLPDCGEVPVRVLRQAHFPVPFLGTLSFALTGREECFRFLLESLQGKRDQPVPPKGLREFAVVSEGHIGQPTGGRGAEVFFSGEGGTPGVWVYYGTLEGESGEVAFPGGLSVPVEGGRFIYLLQ